MKKLLSLVFCMALISTNTVHAEITQDGGTGTSEATVNQTAAVFSVTVPTQLLLQAKPDGESEVGNAVITNNSDGPVKVSNVEINATGGWQLADYGSDFINMKVDTQEIGFMLNNGTTTDSGYTFDEANFPTMSAGGTLDLTYSSKIPPRQTALTEEQVANVVFTVDWVEAEEILGQIKTFTVENQNYEFETGMTWEDWLESTYNTYELSGGVTGRNFKTTGGIFISPATGATQYLSLDENGENVVELGNKVTSGTYYSVTSPKSLGKLNVKDTVDEFFSKYTYVYKIGQTFSDWVNNTIKSSTIKVKNNYIRMESNGDGRYLRHLNGKVKGDFVHANEAIDGDSDFIWEEAGILPNFDLPQFCIDNSQNCYNFEEGMTWAEFIDEKDYSMGWYDEFNNKIYTTTRWDSFISTTTSTDNAVLPTDKIIENNTYELIYPGDIGVEPPYLVNGTIYLNGKVYIINDGLDTWGDWISDVSSENDWKVVDGYVKPSDNTNGYVSRNKEGTDIILGSDKIEDNKYYYFIEGDIPSLFYVGNDVFELESNMSWKDFINSDKNTKSFMLSPTGKYVVTKNGSAIVDKNTHNYISSESSIEKGMRFNYKSYTDEILIDNVAYKIDPGETWEGVYSYNASYYGTENIISTMPNGNILSNIDNTKVLRSRDTNGVISSDSTIDRYTKDVVFSDQKATIYVIYNCEANYDGSLSTEYNIEVLPGESFRLNEHGCWKPIDSSNSYMSEGIEPRDMFSYYQDYYTYGDGSITIWCDTNYSGD